MDKRTVIATAQGFIADDEEIIVFITEGDNVVKVFREDEKHLVSVTSAPDSCEFIRWEHDTMHDAIDALHSILYAEYVNGGFIAD